MTWMSAGHKLESRSCESWVWEFERGQNDCVAVGGGDADVVDERVEPDVGDEIGVEGQGNAPVQPRRRAGDAQVFELVVFEKTEDFVAAVIGLR